MGNREGGIGEEDLPAPPPTASFSPPPLPRFIISHSHHSPFPIAHSQGRGGGAWKIPHSRLPIPRGGAAGRGAIADRADCPFSLTLAALLHFTFFPCHSLHCCHDLSGFSVKQLSRLWRGSVRAFLRRVRRAAPGRGLRRLSCRADAGRKILPSLWHASRSRRGGRCRRQLPTRPTSVGRIPRGAPVGGGRHRAACAHCARRRSALRPPTRSTERRRCRDGRQRLAR